jgi:8-oxo-dGTP pyrophosphatase MutT (NUDIX family)
MPHIHEKIDFCAEVFIVHNNKVLLRKHDKLGIWLGVGGHIELDEDPNQAAIREVKEEVGLDVELYNPTNLHKRENFKELIPPKHINRHKINDTHEHIALVYFAKANTDQLVLSKIEVTEDCKWLTKEELNDLNLNKDIKKYAIHALELLQK